MSGPLALGLLGAGRIGRVHARSLAVIEDARLVAVADPDEAAAATVARLTGARVASADEVLDDPAIQGVLIATPTDLHAESPRPAPAPSTDRDGAAHESAPPSPPGPARDSDRAICSPSCG